jgi:Zn-dependent protease
VIILYEIKIKGIRFGVAFSFLAVVGLLCTGGGTGRTVLTALVCCLLHELGHLTFMLLFSRKPESVILYGGGIRIKPSAHCGSQTEDIIILLSGCAVNFACALGSLHISGLGTFSRINLILGVFNLLPFGYFDGGRVLQLIIGDGRWYDIIRACFILLIGLFAAVSALYRTFGLSKKQGKSKKYCRIEKIYKKALTKAAKTDIII